MASQVIGSQKLHSLEVVDSARFDENVYVDGDIELVGDLTADNITVEDDLEIVTGDLTITAGDEIITAGDLTLTAGDIALTAGDLNVSLGEVNYRAATTGSTGTVGTVTQITSITTGVTLNARRGIITTFSSTLATITGASFLVTNSTVGLGDLVLVNVVAYSGNADFVTQGSPVVSVITVSAGSFRVGLVNAGGASLNGTVSIGFEVIKLLA